VLPNRDRYNEAETSQEKTRDQRRRNKLEQLLDDEEMKFSHSIQFNAVPDWSSHYIAYSNLKKMLENLGDSQSGLLTILESFSWRSG
jgi:SPX domain